MIIDTSAVIAALYQEAARDAVVAALESDQPKLIGSPTFFETTLVLCLREGELGERLAVDFRDGFRLEEVPFDDIHRTAAGIAFLRYGKGRHPARLNLGDCMSYAVAKVAGEPLLCVGDDFAKTDLELVPLG